MGREALDMDPELPAVKLAHGQIERNELGLPVHGGLSKAYCGILQNAISGLFPLKLHLFEIQKHHQFLILPTIVSNPTAFAERT
ncbi:hypothetical protein sS8_1844 [Methylocaldum marinum]|uniref:Uncharacterized protein n=1 Tax=Methylocaldum marinum TaxID=1432792 RepID=A0A250KQB3_9GAMM|nr:hypothetical protein sS8_1844 [Methylocaldum marinum]